MLLHSLATLVQLHQVSNVECLLEIVEVHSLTKAQAQGFILAATKQLLILTYLAKIT